MGLLKNNLFKKFLEKIFGNIKKKLYICSVIKTKRY